MTRWINCPVGAIIAQQSDDLLPLLVTGTLQSQSPVVPDGCKLEADTPMPVLVAELAYAGCRNHHQSTTTTTTSHLSA
jgi:hypothetical protein